MLSSQSRAFPRLAVVAVAATVAFVAGCSAPDRSPSDSGRALASLDDTSAVACPDSSAGLTLPAGFCASVFAEGVAHGRHVAVAANGDVYRKSVV